MGRLALQMGNHNDAIKYFSQVRAARIPWKAPIPCSQAVKYARNLDELAAVCTTKHATEIQLQALSELAQSASA